jgi:hypothetical protein
MRVLTRPQPVGCCLTCTGEGVRGTLARFGWGFRFRNKRKMARLSNIRRDFGFWQGGWRQKNHEGSDSQPLPLLPSTTRDGRI